MGNQFFYGWLLKEQFCCVVPEMECLKIGDNRTGTCPT